LTDSGIHSIVSCMKDESIDQSLLEKRYELRMRSENLPGHLPNHPAQELERVAACIREQEIRADVYGTGKIVEDFENEVAALLGTEAARYMPSGCMAQPIALRIWAERVENFATAFHATSHLELHEEHGYQWLHGLEAHLLGDPSRPTLAADLEALPQELSSLLIELPAREIGGQLPSWGELVALTDLARSRNIRLHLDGARLWEAQAFYERPHSDICGLFDSVYVSFYKGIGALAGAMLLGPTDFIAEAALWQRRQGGTLHSSLANIVSARTRIDRQIERMPSYRRRAREAAVLWAALDGVEVLPDPPQVNMFHLRFETPAKAMATARDRVAEEHGIWLMGNPRPDGPASRTEITIGDAGLGITDERLQIALTHLQDEMKRA